MKFLANIDVMPLKALLDPQGKAVNNSLKKTGFESIENVRIGKHISFEIEASDQKSAEKSVDEVCRKVLTNPIMEGFTFIVSKME
ncbi:MAG: phosphoribosylformylglycinamidine synthase subunit PurS [Bacteroidales bacterium]|nr:phosphoribosylformylglycinamidine synthase subunit PurS [Bacteroidales bacterium]HQP04211.1 phosphoribosylformylglycinamidine synthase subunit PurS [Bacteroidales bacterium]